MASERQPSTEARELELVKKVELRIALAESDQKLQTLLGTYLAPLLLKLNSEYSSVQQKVISVCQHLNVRLQSQTIKLPVDALLKQAKANRTASLLRNFDLTFLQKGLQRLDGEAKAALLPEAIRGISDDYAVSHDFGAEVFNIFLRLLSEYQIPPRGSLKDLELKNLFAISKEDSLFIASWIGKLVLVNRVRDSRGEYDSPPSCPGLASDEVIFLTLFGKRDAFDPTAAAGLNLTATKIRAAKFLASALFNDHERFVPAICAASNSNSDINVTGEDILKRATASADLENSNTINELFDLFSARSGENSGAAPPVPLRIRVLSLLSKSTAVSNSAPRLLSIVSNGLYPQNDTPLTIKELNRLRSATIQFFTSVLRTSQATSKQFDILPFIYYFMNILQQQQWPKPHPEADKGLRRQVYEVVGAALPMVHDIDCSMIILEFLFDSLALDASGEETALSIQEALLTSMRSFGLDKTQETVQDRLTELLLKHSQPNDGDLSNVEQIETTIERFKKAANLNDDENVEMADDGILQDQTFAVARSSRYVSLRYANRCLEYRNASARWIDIIAIGAGKRSEVIDEGRRGLDPYWFRSTNADVIRDRSALANMPKVSDFIRLTSQRLFESEHDVSLNNDTSAMDVDHNLSLPDPDIFLKSLGKYCKASVGPYLEYLRQLLLFEALQTDNLAPDIDKADWIRGLESSLESSRTARTAIIKYLKSSFSQTEPVHSVPFFYARLSTAEWMSANQEIGTRAIKVYAELVALAPDELLASLPLREDMSRLDSVVRSNNRSQRNLAAHALGLLSSFAIHTDSALGNVAIELSSALMKISGQWQNAVGAEVNQALGALLTLSYVFSRVTYRGDAAKIDQYRKPYVALLIDIIKDSRDRTVQEAAHMALGQLSIYRATTDAEITQSLPMTELISKLSESAKKGNEKAILCLGQLSEVLGPEGTQETSTKIEEALYALHDIKETESQFAVGEALSILVCGWGSSALSPKHDVDGPLPAAREQGETIARVVDHIINDCKASKPSLKRAAVIWLLSLVQFCGHRDEIQSRLRSCQRAFKHLLSDKQELVQEAASRGLGLVYEKGDRSLKDDLVRDLVGSFTDNKAQLSGTVTEDTELFDTGALPTGDGSITTYKDILSLASEVGNPSLVYRFMSLAANNSIWSSRAAFGRFGLSNVLSDSSVDGYLSENPKLYPKLFRYRFDPNPNVRRSMNDIWTALVKDSSGTIDRFFEAIIEDILQNMLTKEWRVRQASCDAVADLVQGRPFEKVEPYIGRIWEQCFKVLDDIKGSVREAAASLARTLTGILIRSLEAGDSAVKKADGMLKHVIPFLLSSQGLESTAQEVQFFAIDTLLQIIKKSNGKILRPYIPGLVERLLGLFSSLEDQIVNYLHMNASKYKLTENKIDDMRLMAVRQSPLMEAAERCLDLLDDATMLLLVPRLENAIKTAIGLPSQVACSRVLVSLSTRHNQLFRAQSDRFLGLVQRQLTDRNETVALSYAEAAGYITRVATDGGVMELVAKAKKLYFSSEDDKHRVAAGDVVHAMAKHATDRFSSLSADILPFVFVAKQDSNAQVKELFQKTWDESVGGSRAVLLYLKEIVVVAQAHLDSPRWVLKHASARAIASATEALATGGEDISMANAQILWPALVQAMGGKTWEGKEEVLEAFVKFVEKSPKFWKEKSDVASEITKIITREAKRQNLRYRPYAIRGIGQVAAARADISMLDSVIGIIEPVIDELAADQSDDMDVDESTEAKMTSDVRERTLANAVEALQNSLRTELLQAKEGIEKLNLVLDLITKANSNLHSRTVASSTFDSVKALSPKLSRSVLDLLGDAEANLQTKLWSLLSLEQYASAPEAFRTKRAQAVVALAAVPWKESLKAELAMKVKRDMEAEKSPVIKQMLRDLI